MPNEIIAGQNVGIRRSGTGMPALMIHCALAHTGAFVPLMTLLKDDFSMTAFDLPGHGETEFNATKEYQDQTVDIAAALARRTGTASHLIGHSFGATVALRLAIEHPELVASLTIYEPVNFGLLSICEPEVYEQEIRDNDAFIAAARQKDWPAAARAFLPRWGADGFDQMSDAHQQYTLKSLPMVIESYPAIYDKMPAKRLLPKLPEISVPTLVIGGENSPKVVHRNNAIIARNIPNAKIEVVAGAGHMGMITHAAKIAPLIKGLIG